MTYTCILSTGRTSAHAWCNFHACRNVPQNLAIWTGDSVATVYRDLRMAWKLWSPWPKERLPQKPKSVNIFVGFFFVINLCFSTGFLSIPYVFFYAGYLAAIPTLLIIAFAAWNGARWELEIMARAQVGWLLSTSPYCMDYRIHRTDIFAQK